MTELKDDSSIQSHLRFGRYPAGFVPQPCHPDHTFTDGDVLTIGHCELRIISTAGHTKDSTCFLFEDDGRRGLLTGDVVFYSGKIGLLNLEGCSLSDYRRDIRKLESLDIDILLPGHGVFVLRRGQKHIQRAIQKLCDFIVPPSFFEENEFMWDREYLRTMAG
jgi:hydroxyacylglutathione hydrolase